MQFAHLNPREFIRIAEKSTPLESTGVTNFIHSVMYFEGENFLYLYKPIEGITYVTQMMVDENREVPSLEGEGNIPVDNFKLELLRRFSALELLKPLDWEAILLEHTHNSHTHGGVGFNDIQL